MVVSGYLGGKTKKDKIGKKHENKYEDFAKLRR